MARTPGRSGKTGVSGQGGDGALVNVALDQSDRVEMRPAGPDDGLG